MTKPYLNYAKTICFEFLNYAKTIGYIVIGDINRISQTTQKIVVQVKNAFNCSKSQFSSPPKGTIERKVFELDKNKMNVVISNHDE